MRRHDFWNDVPYMWSALPFPYVKNALLYFTNPRTEEVLLAKLFWKQIRINGTNLENFLSFFWILFKLGQKNIPKLTQNLEKSNLQRVTKSYLKMIILYLFATHGESSSSWNPSSYLCTFPTMIDGNLCCF